MSFNDEPQRAIFDNGAGPKVRDQSRGIVVELDMDEMKATLLREYASPEELLATSQGNMQSLANGNVFIGWGSEPFVSEFSREGKLLFEARFPHNGESYRAFRFPWSGRPTEAPGLAVERRADEVALYASWNGATEVAAWEVLSGPSPGRLESLGSVLRDGFETAMLAQTSDPCVAVRRRAGQTPFWSSARHQRARQALNPSAWERGFSEGSDPL